MSSINVNTIKSRLGGPPTLPSGVVVSAAATFSNDVSIGGTLTYEDVTNVDAVGLITARNGIKFGVAGVGGTIRANGDTTLAGVVTASQFVGDGSGLTNLVGTGVTNNVNTVNLNVISGISTFGGDVSIADKIIHTGDTNTALRFPAADTVTVETGGTENLRVTGAGVTITTSNGGDSELTVEGTGGATVHLKDSGSGEHFRLSANGQASLYAVSSDPMVFYTGGTAAGNERMRITAGGVVKVAGITSTASLTVGPGIIQEKLYNVASALTGTVNFDVVTNGLVQYHTTNSSATFIANLRGDGSTTFNSLMHIGQTSVFTLYSAQNNASYYLTDFKIDGASQTEKWNGGSAPTGGTASGVDVYTFNIMKTADATFTVFATFSNFA